MKRVLIPLVIVSLAAAGVAAVLFVQISDLKSQISELETGARTEGVESELLDFNARFEEASATSARIQSAIAGVELDLVRIRRELKLTADCLGSVYSAIFQSAFAPIHSAFLPPRCVAHFYGE